jgi:hypothetical protein
MTKGIIYYTDNQLPLPLSSQVQIYIAQSGLPITSVSLQPMDFGDNYVMDLEPGYITMLKQIALALEKSSADYVFFCEHDVLYPPSHFEFVPPRDDIFYYNNHVWRWKYPEDYLITYHRLISLSGLCVNRKLALDHYKKRLQKISKLQLETIGKREPAWARIWGYEPGTKKIRRGGFSDDDFATWTSTDPIIDIRHGKTFSPTKVTLDSFTHPPSDWQHSTLDKIPFWDLKGIIKEVRFRI